MYLSILAGQVSHENWAKLEVTYGMALRYPPEGLSQSFLVHCVEDPGLWKMITLWKSKDAFELAKQNKQIDTCFDLFCNLSSIPHRTTFSVIGKYMRI